MSVNGITATGGVDYSAYDAGSKNTAAAATAKSEENAVKSDSGVVYEKSSEAQTDSSKKTYKPNTELISKLKADADARTEQLRSLVQQLFTKQGNAYGIASGDDMWKFLASGNFTVDAATKAQAQADIADDGYWGVAQTSDRILDFAKALSGGDPSKIEELKNAFIKGFKQATGAWGRDLPSISSKTYDATIEKFDQWAKEAQKTQEAEPAAQTEA